MLYLAVQRLRGRPLGAYIRQLCEWERLDQASFQRLRAGRLAQTLEYARNWVPLYRSAPWRDAFARADPADLQSWPVLEREQIQAHNPELIARPVPSPHYFRRTAGSTGKPLTVGVDSDAAAWAWANDYRGLLWHGIRVGARALTMLNQRESALAEWIRNQMPMPLGEMSSIRLSKALRYLQTARPTLHRGSRLRRGRAGPPRQAGCPLGAAPAGPFRKGTGRSPLPVSAEEIEEGLGARVIETYGCNETGTVAYECPAGSLHVFAEHGEVEILRDGEPVEPGESGDIVLTCTTNRVMPLIRYRVGDRGRFCPEPCSCGRPHPVIAGIEGRIGDVLLTATGVPAHGTVLGRVLKAVIAKSPTAIGRVLFEQHDPQTWTVLVQAGPGFGDDIATQLAEGVRHIFGNECRVAVKLVSEIPNEPSGKFRFYRRAMATTVGHAQPGSG